MSDGLRCQNCGSEASKVVDSRASDKGRAIRRRRECLGCKARVTTYETIRYEEPESQALAMSIEGACGELLTRVKQLTAGRGRPVES